ncbi:MAG TPA: TIGR03905 family TSCPD domain-containing protein, partial [Firmicutes bacterium]|nr:TIGR03905 family TSCPD domain-containing protein [Bacillota bacterium]
MKTFEYIPQNVCSRKIIFTIDDNNKIISLEVVGGCNGNLQGISKLVEGMDVNDAIKRLEGIKCRGSRTGLTSCPDQIANA